MLKRDGVPLSELAINKEEIAKFKQHLQISETTSETFTRMEEIYSVRGCFTKNKDIFKDILVEIANEYKKQGVEYAELSHAAIITDLDYLKMIHEISPQIEKNIGVNIRWLAGIWRHSDKEWNEDEVDRIKGIMNSPYVVGVDFMGHETNPTKNMESEIRKLVDIICENKSENTIRMHAGESIMFKDNVADFLKIVDDELDKIGDRENGPKLRIGHGLNGFTDEVVNLAQKLNAIVEFNVSSNLALNNIDDITNIPIKEYIEKGVGVVLGTDGAGIYSTSSSQEVLLAQYAGLGKEDFDKINKTEEEILAVRKKHFEEFSFGQIEEKLKPIYSTEDSKERYNNQVLERYSNQKKENNSVLAEKMQSVGAITDRSRIAKDLNGKTPLLITGASMSNWPNISEQGKREIQLSMQLLANLLNPNKSYIITGGTNYGVEKQVHEAVFDRNCKCEERLDVLGVLTKEAASNDTGDIMPNTITHAVIGEKYGRQDENWYDTPDTVMNMIGANKGTVIAIGGGGVVRDMIQIGHNMGNNMYLMDGVFGASTDKLKKLGGDVKGFSNAEELVTSIYKNNPELLAEDFEIEKMEKYITEANVEVGKRYHNEYSLAEQLKRINSAYDSNARIEINHDTEEKEKTISQNKMDI